MQSDQEPSCQTLDQIPGVLVTCRPEELRPHPSYVKHQISVPASKLSALVEVGEFAFRDPVIITRDRTIIDGYARFELAKLQNRLILHCLEYDLSDLDALRWLVQRHLPSHGYCPFTRILLALDMERGLKEKARSNQRTGGQRKGSSNLTQAERIDVRKATAEAARVSVGTLTKAKQLLGAADSELLEALRNQELSIHRAWQWHKLSRHDQRQNLELYRMHMGLERTVDRLISNQLKRRNSTRLPERTWPVPSGDDVAMRLSALGPDVLRSVNILLISTPGRTIALSKDLACAIGLREELSSPCGPSSH